MVFEGELGGARNLASLSSYYVRLGVRAAWQCQSLAAAMDEGASPDEGSLTHGRAEGAGPAIHVARGEDVSSRSPPGALPPLCVDSQCCLGVALVGTPL